jgi:hypothetical protein
MANKNGYEILTLKDAEKWIELVENMPLGLKDIYSTPQFYSLFEKENLTQAHCFIFKDQGEIALYPYLLTKVNKLGYQLSEDYFDIQAPYGYNGLLASTNDSSFLNKFSHAFHIYCLDQKVIAEMIRFNPVLKNHKHCNHSEKIHVLDNVVIDLTSGFELVWQYSFEKEVRGAVRKAEKHNLEFEYHYCSELPSNRFFDFKEIYHSTMIRNNANEQYFFSDVFFDQLVKRISSRSIIFFTLLDKKPVSTELVLLGDEIAYPYLGGTLAEANYCSPNTYLRHRLLQVLHEKKIKYYSMGGGLKKDDKLFKYKKSFARNALPSPIYIGKKIYNENIYKEIVFQWEKLFPHLAEKYKNYVLKYHFKS